MELMKVPQEDDFLAVFGADPIASSPADGYWCYEFVAEHGYGIRLSFNTHERSVQTVWLSQDRAVCTVVHENAQDIRIVESGETSRIVVRFLYNTNECRTELEILVIPELEIRWASLLL